MAFEVRERRGSLWANGRKEKPSQPDFCGKVRIDGKLYRLSAWEKSSRNGTRWLSITADEFVDAHQSQAEAAEAAIKQQPPPEDFDGDIPF
jgi:hypothetical protein